MKSIFVVFMLCIGVIHADSEDFCTMECVPCTGEVPAMVGDELAYWHEKLQGGWLLVGEHHIEKEYVFENFIEALEFTNRVGVIAERNGHHPYIVLTYGYVKLMLWTHKIEGLSESDFILAAKIDAAMKH